MAIEHLLAPHTLILIIVIIVIIPRENAPSLLRARDFGGVSRPPAEQSPQRPEKKARWRRVRPI
jgi:hypothetical protein